MRNIFPQVATYWQADGYDNFGNRTYKAPVSLPVRWEDNQELFIDSEGQEAVSRASVYATEHPDSNLGNEIPLITVDGKDYHENKKDENDKTDKITLERESYFLFGELTDEPEDSTDEPVNPIDEPNAYKIKAIGITPNLDNTEREVRIWL